MDLHAVESDARPAGTGLRPVPVYRLEERDLSTKQVEVLARRQCDLRALLAVFAELVADQAHRPDGRYRKWDAPYRLVVVPDGHWSQRTVSEVSDRVSLAATLVGVQLADNAGVYSLEAVWRNRLGEAG
jgi:hypothetical protein